MAFTLKFVPLQAKMCSLKTFNIDLEGLNEGKTHFVFDLDNDYFAAPERAEVRGGEVHVEVETERKGDRLQLSFDIKGHVVFGCDRCLDDIVYPTDIREELTVDLLLLDNGQNFGTIDINEDGQFDAAWFAYETIALTLPTRRVHPEGQCDERMERAIADHADRKGQDESENAPIDPRWNELLKLKR
ncbi:MAG: DUF177 domain-containing protein [Prevotellaceae bacterium]|nr:DUF177 domain-containing protein [Prevotella sp.]MDD7529998.1 DUF177 domain-containing protein [Prevotellaceae bacterium]MDY2632966.1 DUF177 domain-containing protein [Prevotella sp.]